MFCFKSITAVFLWSNESGRASCLCILLISWHWRTKKKKKKCLVYTCVCVHGAPVHSADPGQDNECEAMSVFCTIFGDAVFSSCDSLFSEINLFLSARGSPLQLIHH